MKKNHFDPVTIKLAAEVIHVLSHKERIWILNLLEENLEMRPIDIAKELQLPHTIIAKHLTLLLGIKLILRMEVTRKEVYYSVNKDRAVQLRTGVKIISIRRAREYVDYVRIATVA